MAGYGQLPFWQRMFAPQATPGMDPNAQMQIARQTMLQTGLGLLGGNVGTPHGPQIGDIFGNAMQQGNQLAQNAYRNQLANQQNERQQQAFELQRQQAEQSMNIQETNFQRQQQLQKMREAGWTALVAAGQDPMKRRAALEKLALGGDQSAVNALLPKLQPYTLPQGGQRYDQWGNLVATNPKTPEPYTLSPGAMRFDANGQLIGVNPKSAGTTINVGGQKIPPSMVQSAIKHSDSADTLYGQMNELASFRDMASQADTGKLTPVTLPVKQAFHAIGIDIAEDVPLLEALRAQQNQMALRLRNPDSGFGLTGNTSNQDVKFLKQSVAGLENTTQGNLAILTIMMAKQRRQAQLEDLKSNLILTTGTLTGWNTVRQNFIDNVPFFNDQDLQYLSGLRQSVGLPGIPAVPQYPIDQQTQSDMEQYGQLGQPPGGGM